MSCQYTEEFIIPRTTTVKTYNQQIAKDDHQQIDDNMRLRHNPMHYELQQKKQEARNIDTSKHKIHDVNLTSARTQFQATQFQGTSNNHKHN